VAALFCLAPPQFPASSPPTSLPSHFARISSRNRALHQFAPARLPRGAFTLSRSIPGSKIDSRAHRAFRIVISKKSSSLSRCHLTCLLLDRSLLRSSSPTVETSSLHLRHRRRLLQSSLLALHLVQGSKAVLCRGDIELFISRFVGTATPLPHLTPQLPHCHWPESLRLSPVDTFTRHQPHRLPGCIYLKNHSSPTLRPSHTSTTDKSIL